MQYFRGELYYADLSPVVGSEQGGKRPVLIVQNNMGNKFAPTVIVAIVTSRKTKANLPTHYWLDYKYSNLPEPSMVECEQLRTVDKSRLASYIGKINQKDQQEVDKKIKISLGL